MVDLLENAKNRNAEIIEWKAKAGTHGLDSKIADLERQKAELEDHIEVGENTSDERREACDERRAEKQEYRDESKMEKETERHNARMDKLENKKRENVITPIGDGLDGKIGC